MTRKVSLISLVFVLITLSTFAASFLNIGDYEDGTGFFLGASYLYDSRDIILGGVVNKVYTLKYISYDAYMGVNLADIFSVYGIVGLNDFQLVDSMDGEYNFKIGGGVRIEFYEFIRLALKSGEMESKTFNLTIIGDFQMQYFKSKGIAALDLAVVELDWIEYQATLAMAANISPFIFYLGGKASFIDGSMAPSFMDETGFSEDGYFSLLLGGEVDLAEQIRLVGEVSVFSETVITASLQFNF